MSIIQYELTPHEQQILENIKQQILIINNNNESMLNDLEKITSLYSLEIKTLAKNLTAVYHSLKQKTKSIDGIYIDKLPIFSNTNAELTAAKIFALSFSKVLGEPFQYLQQNNGELVAEITPTTGLENDNSSGGKISFGWHSDDSFLEKNYRTKWIQLFGHYNQGKILTKVAIIDDIVKKLDQSTLNALIQKQFLVKLPSSFKFTSMWSKPVPIIRINGEYKYEINVPTYNVKPVEENNQTAWNAIQELVTPATQSQQLFCLRNGALLTFNNDRLLHARDEIKTERLVLQTYIRPNLQQLKLNSFTDNERIFDLTDLVSEDVYGSI